MTRIGAWFALLLTMIGLAAAPAAAGPVRYAQSGDVSIAFEVEGRGEPLVLIPGFSQSRRAWRDAGFVDRFVEQGRQVILIDPRGHGDSNKPHDPGAYSAGAVAGDVIAVLDALAIGRADLLGYSRGGTIALETAIRHPGRVRSVVAGGAHPFAEDMSVFRAAVADGLDRWVAIIDSAVGGLPPGQRAMFLANDPAALRAAVAADRPDRSAALKAAGVPVLLYAGSLDDRAGPAERFAREAGAARFLELPGLNHMQAFFAAGPVAAAVARMNAAREGGGHP